MWKKQLYRSVACAAVLLAGCGGKNVAPAVEPQEPPAAEPEIIAMESTGEIGLEQPAPKAPETEGSITYTPVSGDAKSEQTASSIIITGGCMEIAVSSKAWTADVRCDEGASVRLILQDGAAFTGTVSGVAVQDVFVSLDQTSTWTLTGDVKVGGLVNADATFSNMQSGGYAVQYDSEYADNAYLGGAAKQLPGGGFLTPII